MLLLIVFVATASWSYGFAQEIPMQSPISITKFQKSARMTCEIQTLEANFDGIFIHWYKQKEGEAPERFLFVSEGKVTVESDFQANRYIVEISSVQKRCVLTIKDVIPDDAATYYCAYTVIGYYNKVFGSGTKLIVSEERSSPPKNSEILQKKHENQIIYVCLIEKFYPEVIRVTWTEGEKEVTDNVVKGDTWLSTKEDEYSFASWLTVPAESEDKTYYCKYEHEEKSISLPTQVDSVKTAPQEEDCRTVFNRDQLMHRTAYLVYIILLLKSSMYNIIILFFIYRMWALTKHQGKKA
ncbi:TCR gamma alternate reading frame protein [Onychostruthus taczanowskii]|uniref:TCR gamma alternate reading frame protein n=1 Tax=Onychostruthus taczanowskii TaxID=356909 RepID=UPI001B80B113|nr:TCR gamma alternate reading frame protein [Onychostruthus taczanowskii]